MALCAKSQKKYLLRTLSQKKMAKINKKTEGRIYSRKQELSDGMLAKKILGESSRLLPGLESSQANVEWRNWNLPEAIL